MSITNRKLFERPNAYVIGWPGTSPIYIEHAFEQILVPGRTEVATPGRGSVYRYPSAKDSAGRPIPGTVQIEDKYARDPSSNTLVKGFDAKAYCEGLLGNALGTALEKRGLFIVEDAADVTEAMRASVGTFWRSERRWAENRIREELARRAKEQAAGLPPRDLTEGEYNEIERARNVMAQQPPDGVKITISDEDLRGSLGVPSQVTAPSVVAPAGITATDEPHYDPRVAAAEEAAAKADKLAVAQEVLRRAGEVGYVPTKADLMALLSGDDVSLLEVVQKIEAKAGKSSEAKEEVVA